MSRFAVVVLVCCLAAACSSPKPSTPGTSPDAPSGAARPEAATSPGPSGKLDVGDAPTAPAGYADAAALQNAWQAGQISLVNTEVERPAGVKEFGEIDYGSTDTPRRQLTLDILETRKEAAPVVLIVPPGCWAGATQEAMCRPWLYELASMGCLAGIVDYAGTNAAKTGENLAAAVRWLHANAVRYGGDPKRIVLMGFGDGAWAALTAAYGAAGDTAVNGVVDFYGASDLAAPCWSGNAALKTFLAGGEAASPVKLVKKGVPPTLIFHGVLDTNVPVAQSDALAQCLQSAGVALYYERVEGWGRSLELETRLRERARHIIGAFLRQYVP